MLQGRYEILVYGKRESRLKVRSEIVIEDAPSKVVISKNGEVEILADSVERLHELRLVTQIGIKHASYWNEFELSTGTETELGTGKYVERGIHGDITVSSLTVDETRFRNAVKSLLRTDSRPLAFLVHSAGLSGRPEASALIALTALEIQLDELVRDEDLLVNEKIGVLKYVKALDPTELGRLRNLFKLRNKLAHGDWAGETLKNALGNALGGSPSQWVHPSTGRMKRLARQQVIEEVIKMISVLSNTKPV